MAIFRVRDPNKKWLSTASALRPTYSSKEIIGMSPDEVEAYLKRVKGREQLSSPLGRKLLSYFDVWILYFHRIRTTTGTMFYFWLILVVILLGIVIFS